MVIKMKIKQINKKQLFTKAVEDAMKEAIKMGFLAAVIGLSMSSVMFSVAGAFGGCFYHQNSETSPVGIGGK